MAESMTAVVALAHSTMITTARAAIVIPVLSMWAGREIQPHIDKDTTLAMRTFGGSREKFPSLVP